MTKLLALLLIGAMGLHLVRPIGWPGLKQRRDFWKIAVFALATMGATIALREFSG